MIQGYSQPIDPKTVQLFWEYTESDPPLISIERSEAPHEGFQTIESVISIEDGSYTDTFTVPNENRVYYYRIGGTPLDHGGPPNPLAKEIVRRDQWFLDSHVRHSGSRKAELKIRFVDGSKCSECWDPVHQKVKQSKCSTCGGTGVLNSYSSTLETRVARSMPTLQRSPQPDQVAQSVDEQYWTTNTILCKPGDLLRVEGLIHRVERVQFTRSGSYIVKQILMVKRLEVHREEYSITWE